MEFITIFAHIIFTYLNIICISFYKSLKFKRKPVLRKFLSAKTTCVTELPTLSHYQFNEIKFHHKSLEYIY